MKVKDLFREVKYPIKLYNEQGQKIYYENSDGYIEDDRPKSIIIDGKEITLSPESFKQLKESLGA